MHLMTRSELSYKSAGELSALFGAASRRLTFHRNGERKALLMLENIRRVQAMRR
jgi:hypothetical protein